ncbi:MAG TPA: DUF433 domain-containing protein [Candidatus Baltobacteraceae bacterium]|jgi:uncharacterized protein (DUF433 family)|nr:DUF433 domain-containing protein [Candidatus Baltobacteraceae bacterium]
MTRPSTPSYTPQEAAILAGVRLQRVQNAITNRQFGRTFVLAGKGQRRIDLSAVLTFAAQKQLGKVRIEPKLLYEALRKVGFPRGLVAITDAVTIDAPVLLGPTLRNIEIYDAARKRIVSDPAVMGGLPVVKGTRIPAHTLHARVMAGENIKAILKEYPYLDQEAIESAVLFIEANPPRGRPHRRNASVNG